MLKEFIIIAIMLRLILMLTLVAIYVYGSLKEQKTRVEEEGFLLTSYAFVIFAELVSVLSIMTILGNILFKVGTFGLDCIDKVCKIILKKEKVK